MSRTIILVVVLCVIGVVTAASGPNEGARLILHASEAVYTTDSSSYCGAPPESCDEVVNRVNTQDIVVANVVLSMEGVADPSVAALAFGIEYDTEILIADYGSCGDFELEVDGWPLTGTGTAITFAQEVSSDRVVYWLATYNYYGSPSVLHLSGHPSQGAIVTDGETPPNVDQFLGLGSLGFFADGDCPEPVGACCLETGYCVVVVEDDCVEPNVFLGVGANCDDGLECRFSTDWLWSLFEEQASALPSLFCTLDAGSLQSIVDTATIVHDFGEATLVQLTEEEATAVLLGGGVLARYQGPASGSIVYRMPIADTVVPDERSWSAYSASQSQFPKAYWGSGADGYDEDEYICVNYWVDGEPTGYQCQPYNDDDIHAVFSNVQFRDGQGFDDEFGDLVITILLAYEMPTDPTDGDRIKFFVADDADGPWTDVSPDPLFFRGEGTTAVPIAGTTQPGDLFFRVEFTSDCCDNLHFGPTILGLSLLASTPPSIDVDVELVGPITAVPGDDYTAKLTLRSTEDIGRPVSVGIIRRTPHFFLEDYAPSMVDEWHEINADGSPQEVFIRYAGGNSPETQSENLVIVADPDNWIFETDEEFPIAQNNVVQASYYWPLKDIPVILVPGITGAELEKQYPVRTATIWDESIETLVSTVLTPKGNDSVRLANESPLEDEYDDPAATVSAIGIVDAITMPDLKPWFLLNVMEWPTLFPYDQVQPILPTIDIMSIWDEIKGVNEWKIYEAPYDWRKALSGLNVDVIGEAIERVLQDARSGVAVDSTRITVVAHSFGALAMERYLADEGNNHRVHTWVSLGGTFGGGRHVVSTLLGTNGSMAANVPVLNQVVGGSMRRMAESSSAVYTLAPSGALADQVVYSKRASCIDCDHSIYEATVTQQWSWNDLRTLSIDISDLPDDFYVDVVADDRADVFHSLQLPEVLPREIRFVSGKTPTLDSISFRDETVNYLDDGEWRQVTNRHYYPIVERSGDGTVGIESQLVGGETSELFYVESVHNQMPNDADIALVAKRWTRDEFSWPLPQSVSHEPTAVERPGVLLELKVLTPFVTGVPGVGEPPADIGCFPVALELINHDTGEFEVAGVRKDSGFESNVEPKFQMMYRPEFRSFTSPTQTMLWIPAPDPVAGSVDYTLVLTPDATFWNPEMDTPTSTAFGNCLSDPEEQFDIRCQLTMTGRNSDGEPSVLRFPNFESEHDPIWFSRVWADGDSAPRGFSGRVSFRVYQDGRITGLDGPDVELQYDGDADGEPEGVVTGTDEPFHWAGSRKKSLIVSPNPFVDTVNLATGSVVGDFEVEAFTPTGRSLGKLRCQRAGSGIDVDVSALPRGIVLFEVTGEDGSVFRGKGIALR